MEKVVEVFSRSMKRISLSIPGLLAIAVIATFLFPRRVMIGPANPGAEEGSDRWWVGASGKGYLGVDQTDPASGSNDFTLGNTNSGGDDSAGWRSVIFPLGPAAAGARPITFSFAYKLVDDVNPGDNVHVQLRFFSRATNWLRENNFVLGDSSHDSAMSHYKTVTVSGIYAPYRATLADINVFVNAFGRHWSSGDARFDDFSVTTTTHSWLPCILAVALPGIMVIIVLLLYFRQKSSR